MFLWRNKKNIIWIPFLLIFLAGFQWIVKTPRFHQMDSEDWLDCADVQVVLSLCWAHAQRYLYIFIPSHTIVTGCYGFKLDVRVSVRLAVFCFQMTMWVNINGFWPNLVCALILWRSGLGLLMGKFRQILTELSAWDTPIFSFLDDNLSKYQGILTKLGTCIDMKEFWLWIANGQISSMFDRVICLRYDNGGVL